MTPLRDVVWKDRVKVKGRVVHSMRVRPWRQTAFIECTIDDGTGRILLVFTGRRRIPAIGVGTMLAAEGMVGEHRGLHALMNPEYTLLSSPDDHA